jgi:hypothetical protein
LQNVDEMVKFLLTIGTLNSSAPRVAPLADWLRFQINVVNAGRRLLGGKLG